LKVSCWIYNIYISNISWSLSFESKAFSQLRMINVFFAKKTISKNSNLIIYALKAGAKECSFLVWRGRVEHQDSADGRRNSL